MVAPSSARFSPDGSFVTFLHSSNDSMTLDLFAIDLATGERRRLAEPVAGVSEDAISLEEKLRRERGRDLSLGMSRYAWADDAAVILVPLPDGAHILNLSTRQLRLVAAAADGPVIDPRVSPDGTHVAFVRDAEVYVVPTDGAAPARQITAGARGAGRTHGLAEFIAQEEMGRSAGFWWSTDSTQLAVAEVDETHIPVYRIVHQGSDQVGPEAEEDHRYPFAGADNARVRLGVVDVASASPVEPQWLVDVGDGYLARVDWCKDGTLAVQVENREQTRLELRRVDARSGASSLLVAEESDVWINLHDHFRALDDGRFIWSSERSGFRHLELRNADGSLARSLTHGEWVVTTLDAVDEQRGRVWFTATREGPRERHAYEVGFDAGEPRRLTTEPGSHAIVIDHARERFLDTFASAERPPSVTVRSLADGSTFAVLHDERDPRIDSVGLAPPEFTTLSTRDDIELHALVYRPGGGGPFPTVVSVYGGPHAQRVVDHWSVTASLRAQYLRQQGYLVIAVDNRGSANRGLEFEAPIKWDMGHVEVDDQVDAVRHFVALGLADPARVAIYGWSYGGYMSALCLAKEPDTFTAAVAGAPVTAWDGYDTHYTERYMGTPESNPAGYKSSAVLTHAGGISGNLMVVHGLIDENVHFRHTARLQNALIAHRVPAELLLFPDERHVPRHERDRIYMEERIVDFLQRNLGS